MTTLLVISTLKKPVLPFNLVKKYLNLEASSLLFYLLETLHETWSWGLRSYTMLISEEVVWVIKFQSLQCSVRLASIAPHHHHHDAFLLPWLCPPFHCFPRCLLLGVPRAYSDSSANKKSIPILSLFIFGCHLNSKLYILERY